MSIINVNKWADLLDFGGAIEIPQNERTGMKPESNAIFFNGFPNHNTSITDWWLSFEAESSLTFHY